MTWLYSSIQMNMHSGQERGRGQNAAFDADR